MNKTLIGLAAVAAAIASPAFAAKAQKAATPPASYAQSAPTMQNWSLITDGRELGTDPDPSVRANLARDFFDPRD